MARSPLFDSFSRMVRIATFAARKGPRVAPVDELVEMAYSRRRFIRDTALATAAVAGGALSYGCGQSQTPTPASTGTRVAIVGAGMAGLNTAYKLQKAGIKATIFEGSDRTGGRMFTARDLMGEGLTTELGGEFIDSTHEEMLALMTEFGLERLDTLAPEAESLKKETYFINGRHYTQAQAAKEFVPIAKRIMEDYDALGDVVDYKEEGGGKELDNMSLAEYFDKIGAKGWMRELFDVAYVTEYGLDVGEQSALNFVFLIGTGDLEDTESLELFGESDERYKVRGGNQRVVDELAKRVESQIRKQHRLEAVKSKGQGYTLVFQGPNGTPVEEDADLVVLAVPFTMLREVDIQVELPPLKRTAIQQLGYGANAKVLVPFKSRPWQKLGYSGATYSDQAFQLAWDNSFLQAGTAGGLTLYSGGKLALDAGMGSPEEVAARLLPGIEKAYPGTIKQRTDKDGKKVARMHWPTFPWVKASYSCYKPGQWTTIAGSEGVPAGNLYFAGEHCSYDFQGYMNGAAQSGVDTAKAMMSKLSLPKAAQALVKRVGRG